MSTKTTLFLIVGLALAIRLLFLEHNYFWIDEQQSALSANGISTNTTLGSNSFSSLDVKNEKTLGNMVKANIDRDSGNGILYSLVLFSWTDLFGNTALSTRLVSVIFSLFTVILIFYFTNAHYRDGTAGRFAALLFSVHPMAITSAQEARSYSMAIFFITLSVFLFLNIIQGREKTRGWAVIGYGISSGLALLSHYLTLYILVAEVIIATLFLRDFTVWRKVVMAGLIALFVLITWMSLGGWEGIQIMGERNENYIRLSNQDPTHSFYGKATASSTLAGVIQVLTNLFGVSFQNGGMRIRESLPFFIPLLLVIISYRKIFKQQLSTYLPLSILIFSAPLFAVLLSVRSGHMVSFQSLYANFSVPFVCIFFGLLMAKIVDTNHVINKISVVLYLLIIISSSIVVFANDRHEGNHSTNPEMVAHQIESNYVKGDTVTFKSWEEALLVNMYFKNEEIIQQVKADHTH